MLPESCSSVVGISNMWQSLFVSSVAGVVAAVTFAGLVRLWGSWQARKEATAIRKIIVEDRCLIFDAKDVPDPEDLGKTFARADEWRAMLYNKMLEEVGRILDHWSPHLPQERKQSLLRALDWYHREGVFLAPGPRVVGHKFTQVEPGTLPGNQMSLDQAKEKFAKLEAVKWLKLPKVEPSD